MLNIAALKQEARKEAAILVRKICARQNGESVKTCIARAAVALGFSYSRTAHIYWEAARTIHSWEMDLMRRLAAKEHQN